MSWEKRKRQCILAFKLIHLFPSTYSNTTASCISQPSTSWPSLDYPTRQQQTGPSASTAVAIPALGKVLEAHRCISRKPTIRHPVLYHSPVQPTGDTS
ncbi:hypothetical protein B0T18DRAFT_398972 [Schizothecium vesticola]|uniref:Uncharacterized protein n=1 Tax=Schizothecium vesticola TaxID=314040 RepID=A0AA40KD08_9PEZI|nr:hypothetical protein B0T18DRAFT_398972 [Schizothecium vesticola]